ncbi:helix-turn-helix transcriptional regulator [Streptomyces sp. NPDC048663]|uniref:helix-turn-helix domain-containing protein n=1 Tax=Streptomyces sp. NPDC048663 TaxID=3155638 RepID=UPI003435FC93
MSSDPSSDEWLSEERQRVGQTIRTVRMRHNLTQEQVFLAVPMSRAHYQAIEGGSGNPSLEMLLRISRVIGVPLADLVR